MGGPGTEPRRGAIGFGLVMNAGNVLAEGKQRCFPAGGGLMTISGTDVDRLVALLGFSAETLWLAYLHEGGSVSCAQIERFIDGKVELDPEQREILVEVLRRRLFAPGCAARLARDDRTDVVVDLTVRPLPVDSTEFNSRSNARR